MGEADNLKKSALAQASEEAMVADTMGGRMRVRWDDTAQATPHGQIVFFAEFLATAGVFDRWMQGCPWHYTSPNASRSRDVLGTLMLDMDATIKPLYGHQPAQARSAQPCAAHLLDWQSAPGAQCGAELGQATQLGVCQGGDGPTTRRVGAEQGPGAGVRGLRLRQ
ncbi:hypothetical protein [Paraburkholderia sp. BL17N1]|uniref:hypothetical protein n=1 Tax=Paraburkholderia sp. BL17N1 TaxID=1938798 RepID=UPI001F546B89|nr:hypothetical protein [Paraburkholderia sp. BL17N1]